MELTTTASNEDNGSCETFFRRGHFAFFRWNFRLSDGIKKGGLYVLYLVIAIGGAIGGLLRFLLETIADPTDPWAYQCPWHAAT